MGVGENSKPGSAQVGRSANGAASLPDWGEMRYLDSKFQRDMINDARFATAIGMFDAYNEQDPHRETWQGEQVSKELLYARRMSERLQSYMPDAPEYLVLAARCQHIGRWEIPRNTYAMDRKGYLQWRNQLKVHHTQIAGRIMREAGYDDDTISHVNSLLLKEALFQHRPDTQALEDVICLVFIEYYLEEFAEKHDDKKLVDILRKTLHKMSAKAIEAAGKIAVSDRVASLIGQAVAR